jgi:hypothetical protein
LGIDRFSGVTGSVARAVLYKDQVDRLTMRDPLVEESACRNAPRDDQTPRPLTCVNRGRTEPPVCGRWLAARASEQLGDWGSACKFCNVDHLSWARYARSPLVHPHLVATAGSRRRARAVQGYAGLPFSALIVGVNRGQQPAFGRTEQEAAERCTHGTVGGD